MTHLTIRNYRCIESLDVALGRFHVLVGPNGSGKSTLLDALAFVRSCLVKGLVAAAEERAPEFRDLTFMRRGGDIDVQIAFDLLATARESLRYGLQIGADATEGCQVRAEFLQDAHRMHLRTQIQGLQVFFDEDGRSEMAFSFGRDRLALSVVPPDLTRFPTSNLVRQLLADGVRYVHLDVRAMRQPCSALRPADDLESDGSNLARVVGRLKEKSPEAVADWIGHLQYALDDLEGIGWGKRPPDNAEYITLRYKNGLECPSWLLSDGTLRVLALTLLAFMRPKTQPYRQPIYMIEEPENGVHPRALETILTSLANVPEGQVFVATHSPLVVQQVGVEPLLCFSRDESGTHVVAGKDHPVMKEWEGEPYLSTVFANGLLE
jgi:predicted ATPase